MKFEIELRNTQDPDSRIKLQIVPDDHALARDWMQALEALLVNGNMLEKNYCWLGWPWTVRDQPYLQQQIQACVDLINGSDLGYAISQQFWPGEVNDDLLNHLHHHFEQLQGTVENPSRFYARANKDAQHAIRKLNLLCHELESLRISQAKYHTRPEWIRPSTIVTFLHAPRHLLLPEHRLGFRHNRYDRELGRIYMHWCQIGKTYYEVWRDESAPDLDDTVCSAITDLKYYSGEFDIEWGRNITENGDTPWHDRDMRDFRAWLKKNHRDPEDLELSLGYLPVARIDLQASFGTQDPGKIWPVVAQHQDIFAITVGAVRREFPYSLQDQDYDIKLKESI